MGAFLRFGRGPDVPALPQANGSTRPAAILMIDRMGTRCAEHWNGPMTITSRRNAARRASRAAVARALAASRIPSADEG